MVVRRAIFLTFLVCAIFTSVYAQVIAKIADIKAWKEEQVIYTSFGVENAFTDRMEKAIKSGIPSTFTYYIMLVESNSALFGEKRVVSRTIKRTVTYDIINNRYFVTMREGDDPIAMANFDEVKKLMVSVNKIAVAPTSWLLPNREYKLKVKAELDKIKLPFYLHYLFIFVSLWDFKTDWVEVDIK